MILQSQYSVKSIKEKKGKSSFAQKLSSFKAVLSSSSKRVPKRKKYTKDKIAKLSEPLRQINDDVRGFGIGSRNHKRSSRLSNAMNEWINPIRDHTPSVYVGPSPRPDLPSCRQILLLLSPRPERTWFNF